MTNGTAARSDKELSNTSLPIRGIRWFWSAILILYLLSAFRFGMFSVAHVLTIAIIFVFFLPTARKAYPILFVLVTFWLLKLTKDATSVDWNIENAKTNLLLIGNVALICVVSNLDRRYLPSIKQIALFVNLNAIHAVFLVFQFIHFNLYNNFSTLNPFGSYSPIGPNPVSSELTAYNPILQAIKRPNGLNWEPSAAGFWIMFATSTTIAYWKQVPNANIKLAALIAGGVATFSILTWVSLCFILVVHFWQLGRTAYLVRIPLLILAAAMMLALAVDPSLVISLMPGRLAELGEIGSSGYVRVTAPLMLIKEYGIGLLGLEAVGDRRYNELYWFAATSGRTDLTGIGNSYYEIAIYFGFLGLLLLAGTIALVMRAYSSKTAALIAALLIAPMLGGYTFNTVFVFALAVHILISRPLIIETLRTKRSTRFVNNRLSV